MKKLGQQLQYTQFRYTAVLGGIITVVKFSDLGTAMNTNSFMLLTTLADTINYSCMHNSIKECIKKDGCISKLFVRYV